MQFSMPYTARKTSTVWDTCSVGEGPLRIPGLPLREHCPTSPPKGVFDSFGQPAICPDVHQRCTGFRHTPVTTAVGPASYHNTRRRVRGFSYTLIIHALLNFTVGPCHRPRTFSDKKCQRYKGTSLIRNTQPPRVTIGP